MQGPASYCIKPFTTTRNLLGRCGRTSRRDLWPSPIPVQESPGGKLVFDRPWTAYPLHSFIWDRAFHGFGLKS